MPFEGAHRDTDDTRPLGARGDPELQALGVTLEQRHRRGLRIEQERGRVHDGLEQGRLHATLEVARDSSTPRCGLQGLQRGVPAR